MERLIHGRIGKIVLIDIGRHMNSHYMKAYLKCYPQLAVCCLIIALLSCRSNQDILPQVARIQLVLSHNERVLPVYFLEDSSLRKISFEVYFFDQAGAFVTPAVTPKFFVNNEPLAGNTFPFKQAGEFTVTAQISDRISDNSLIIRTGFAKDNIRLLTVKSAVASLNADSTSRLTLSYEVIDQQGHRLDSTDYNFPIQLMVDGRAQTQTAFITASHPGPVRLQASIWSKVSEVYTVTARAAKAYPMQRLPVIMHIPNTINSAQIDPAAILAEVNRSFRAAKSSTDPNQANAYLEFIPATTDPDGQPLSIPGLNRLPMSNPIQLDSAAVLVDKIVHRWCPQQYINVFVSIDWIRAYPAGWSYSYLPRALANAPVNCEQINAIQWTPKQIPAIFIYDQQSFVSLDHELGHFLGLSHTFEPGGCTGPQPMVDVPQHEKSYADRNGFKYTCDKTPFVSEYVMDYYVPHNSFTYGQVEKMRAMIQVSSYIPSTGRSTDGRRVVALPSRLESGSITN